MQPTIDVDPESIASKQMAYVNAAMSVERVDPIVDEVGNKGLADIVQLTPKRWTGQVRAGWQVLAVKTQTSTERVIFNDYPGGGKPSIMLFLEYGTAEAGAGWVYPKTAKKLFVPLRPSAMGGWHEGLKYGVDYVLKDRVRGIRPMFIVRDYQPKLDAIMAEAAGAYTDRILAEASAIS